MPQFPTKPLNYTAIYEKIEKIWEIVVIYFFCKKSYFHKKSLVMGFSKKLYVNNEYG